MRLENLVFDARDPHRLGRFWEAALGTTTMTDNEHGFETRLDLGEHFLDLCFQPVSHQPDEPVRLDLDLLGGPAQQEVADRLIGLGAAPLDIGQGDVPWVVLADVEGNPFCVMEERTAYGDTGPVAALPLGSGDTDRDGALWEWLTGWHRAEGTAPVSLRHPSGTGPLLELCPEGSAKDARKNRLHLDLRLDAGEDFDAVTAGIVERGGRLVEHDWGALRWRVYADGSGNEFCVLPAA